jgi:PST family polysaccharide transporter
VVGSVLFPTWFFQGIEEMKFITVLNFLLKLSFTIGVFAFVNEDKDYIIVQIINSIGTIVVGLLSFLIILFHYKVKLRLVSVKIILFQLTEGWYIFITSILTTLYNQSNIFILGIFTNNTIVGYFAIADKVRSLLLTTITPLTQALFPYLSGLYKTSKNDFLIKHTLIFKAFSVFTLLLFFAAYLFKERIVLLISGEQFLAAVPILEILIFSVLINGIGYVFTTLFLIVKGSNKLVFRFFLGSLITYCTITLSLFLLNSINEYTLSIGLVLSELVVVVCAMFNYFKWKNSAVRML